MVAPVTRPDSAGFSPRAQPPDRTSRSFAAMLRTVA